MGLEMTEDRLARSLGHHIISNLPAMNVSAQHSYLWIRIRILSRSVAFIFAAEAQAELGGNHPKNQSFGE
jgi:hypothetical protein